jgi:hypothetical protein
MESGPNRTLGRLSVRAHRRDLLSVKSRLHGISFARCRTPSVHASNVHASRVRTERIPTSKIRSPCSPTMIVGGSNLRMSKGVTSEVGTSQVKRATADPTCATQSGVLNRVHNGSRSRRETASQRTGRTERPFVQLPRNRLGVGPHIECLRVESPEFESPEFESPEFESPASKVGTPPDRAIADPRSTGRIHAVCGPAADSLPAETGVARNPAIADGASSGLGSDSPALPWRAGSDADSPLIPGRAARTGDSTDHSMTQAG